MAEAEATERDIDAAREAYRPLARRAALLFFAASELAGVDPMYQFSLGWFRALFVRAMEDTPKVWAVGGPRGAGGVPEGSRPHGLQLSAASEGGGCVCGEGSMATASARIANRTLAAPHHPQADTVEARGAALSGALTYSLYASVCRSLFERHRLMFSLSLAVKVGGAAPAPRGRQGCSRPALVVRPAGNGKVAVGPRPGGTGPQGTDSPACPRRPTPSRLRPQVLQQQGRVDAREWRFLLAGPTGALGGAPPPNPGAGWLTDKAWAECLALDALPAFEGFAPHLAASEGHYRAIFDSAQAGRAGGCGWERERFPRGRPLGFAPAACGALIQSFRATKAADSLGSAR
jgi:hypothetical protein